MVGCRVHGGVAGCRGVLGAGRGAASPVSLRSSSRTYEVVLGEYDLGASEGPEQRVPVDPANIFVHPKWLSFCAPCG